MGLGLWAVLGSLIGLVTISIVLYYTGGWEAVRELMAWLRHSISQTFDLMPNILKVFFFLFFVLTLTNFTIGTFVNLNYACTSDGDLRIPNGRMLGGVVLGLQGMFEGYDFENSTPEYNASYDNFIENRTYAAATYDEDSAEGLFYVTCYGTDPKLTLKGIDIFNFKYWVLIMLITLIFGLGIKAKQLRG